MGRKALPEPASNTEVENIKRQIEADSFELDQAEGRAAIGNPEAHLPATEVVDIDRNAVQRRIRRNKQALESLDPRQRKIKGSERQGLEAEYNHLTEWLQERMLTIQERDAFPAKANDSDAAVKDAMYQQAVRRVGGPEGESSPSFITAARRWQSIGRLLWPDDDDKCGLDSIRPEGTKSGRHFQV